MENDILYTDCEVYREYKTFLEQVNADIQALISECDAKFVNNSTQSVPIDVQFDVVPLLRRLQDVKKEAEQSFQFLLSGQG